MRQRPRPARRGLGCGRCRRGWRTGRREECQHDRQHEEGQQTTETTPPEHGYSLLTAWLLVHPRGAGSCTSRAKRGCLHVRTSRPRGQRPVPARARIPGARDGSRLRQRDIRRTRRQHVGPQERHADGPPRGAATDRPAGWPRGQPRRREGGLHGHHRADRRRPEGEAPSSARLLLADGGHGRPGQARPCPVRRPRERERPGVDLPGQGRELPGPPVHQEQHREHRALAHPDLD